MRAVKSMWLPHAAFLQVAQAGTSVRSFMRLSRRAARHGSVRKPSSSRAALIVDGLISLLMCLSLWQLVALSSAAGSGALPTMSQLALYDADAMAPARFFMPAREVDNGAASAPLPGQPGRWSVGGERSSGLQDLSDGLAAVEHLMHSHVGWAWGAGLWRMHALHWTNE